jgi:hypothetical protein
LVENERDDHGKTARGDGNGGWDHRIAYVDQPMTRAQVEEMSDEWLNR